MAFCLCRKNEMFIFLRILFSNTPYLISLVGLVVFWYCYIRYELGSAKFHYVQLVLICLVSIPFLKSVIKYTRHAYNLAKNGVKLKATVTNTGVVYSNRGTGLAEVEFEYEYRGKKYTKTDKLPLCRVGSKIDVLINPKQPETLLHI